ncbi:MAG: substrate-binding domain-containing protein [Caldimonas sp.]
MLRRSLLVAGLSLAGSPTARAQKFPGATAPLRLGVDYALVESGLGPSLRRAFGADTGIAVKLVAGPALAVLEAVKEGELDAALSNAPAAESALEEQGLVHDRRAIATSEFLLVGPASRGRGKAGAAGRSGTEALTRIRDLASAAPGSLVFLSAGDGSGTHLAEQALWRAAGIAPIAPWYVSAAATTGFVGRVRARGAYALVERGAWSAAGGAPLAVLAEGDAQLAESIHAMRAFRIPHPAGRIFVAWIAGGHGHAVVAAHRGYRPPA